MRVYLYALYHGSMEVYTAPQPQQNDNMAIQSLYKALQDQNAPVAQNPFDYALFNLGEYDDQSGLITPLIPPKPVITAVEALQGLKKHQKRLLELQQDTPQGDTHEVSNDSES